MSFWVYLNGEDGEPVAIARFAEGGTQVVGGSTEAALNITYNYSKYYYRHLNGDDGLRWLNGRRAGDCIPQLRSAVVELGTVRQERDYWKATEGNAGFALSILLKWAEQYPDATFEVS